MTHTLNTLNIANAERPAQISDVQHICPRYEYAVQLLGKRWTGLLLFALMDGPRRFCELTSTVEGLSDRVLSDRLRELEVEGIVERIVYPRIPVRIEYQLTEKGHALRPVFEAVQEWATQWVELPDMLSETDSTATEQ
jgi:DNA-binding HxlR family transcriptional regulator